MSPPPPRRHLLLLLLILLAFFPPLLLASSSFPLPTIAIAAVNSTNSTASSQHNLACALVPCEDGNGTDYKLSCASLTNRSASPRNYSYGGGAGGGGSTAFSAVVAGDGYLCSAAPTTVSSPPMSSLRWWDLEDVEEPSKRVYRGTALSAVSGGGEYVCGLADDRIQCWRWSSGTFPVSQRFSALAVGGGFVCALAKGSGEVRCFGGGGGGGGEDNKTVAAAAALPEGRHAMLAAGERHACAVAAGSGEVVCWGERAAVSAASPRIAGGRSVSALAVGDAVTCVLWGNWTVACCPPAQAAPPREVAHKQFVALEAAGKVVCGVLMSDYSLHCWGPGVSGEASSKVFDRVLPGPCAPWTSCTCGIWSGSASLCGGRGDAAVCYPCGYNPPTQTMLSAQPPASNSPAASSQSSTNKAKRRVSDLVIALVSAGIGSGVLAAVAAVVAVYCLRRRRRRSGSGGVSPDPGRIHAEPIIGLAAAPPRVERRLSALLSKGPNTTVEQFPLASLRAATDGFSPSHRVGSGSFGAVYRATLPDGREVAIKRAERRLRGDSAAGGAAAASCSASVAARRADEHEVAFVAELALLSRVNHKNLVRLLGFCADAGERVLVYEYMPNGSLHDALHKQQRAAAPSLPPPLASWPARLRLALGAARGVEYMHTYAVPPIIHRDIKSPNILLDATWTAKVSDFGLSLLLVNDDDNNHNDNVAAAGVGGDEEDDDVACATAGTVGYMDPEYYRLQHLTEKSDVYSFGVVLLELLSGCRVIQRFDGGSGTPKNVVDVTVPHIEADRVHRVLDARLPLPTPGEMEAVAYVGYLASDCVRPAGRDRPTMSEVVGVLERAVAACEEHDDGGEEAAVLSRSCTDGSTTT